MKPHDPSFAAAVATPNGDVFIGGRGGRLERSDDLGATWTPIDTGFDDDVNALAEAEQ